MRGRRWPAAAGWLLWIAGGVWFLVSLIAHGRHTYLHDQHLVATGPRVTATVVQAKKEFLDRRGQYDVTVRVEGREALIAMDFPHQDDLSPGDPLVVLVDPADPTRVIAANTYDDWSYTPYGDVLTLGVAVVVVIPLIICALPMPHRRSREGPR